MRTATNWRVIPWPLLASAIVVIVAGCTSPLDIDTPRRLTRINLDSVVATEGFINAPGDSIFAYIDDREVVFATEVNRPINYNRQVNGSYYVSISARRYGSGNPPSETMGLSLDAIRDTGTYAINASAKVDVKERIDTTSPPTYGMVYSREVNGPFPETYLSGERQFGGSVRIVRIDEERSVMTGTFTFTGYDKLHDSTVHVDRGAFRVHLDK